MKRRYLPILLMLPAMLACSTGQPTVPSTVSPRMREHRLELFNNHLFLPVTVNDVRTMALLDSTARETVLDDDFARRIGVKPVKAVAATNPTDVESIEADLLAAIDNLVGIELDYAGFGSSHMPILDLADVSQRVGRPVDLRIGREAIVLMLRIDIEKGTIQRLDYDSRPAGVRLLVGDHRGAPTVPAVVDHEPVQAVFDLGNGGEVRIGRAYAERIGLTRPDRIVERRSGGGANERQIVILRSLTIAGRTFNDVPAAIDASEGSADLDVGISVLRHFVITTDLLRQALWLEPRK